MRAPAAAPLTPALEGAIADYLAQLLGPARPRRVARMLDPGKDKYRDVPRHVELDQAKLERHICGVETWAATLDQNGMSRAGVIEVDQGGLEAVQSTLRAAERLGLFCFAIAVDNPLSGHSGGHVWFLYDRPYPIADIRAQLQQVATAAGLPAGTEIWPRAQVIRLPFGYHRWAKTRGALLTQNGEVLDLDSDLAAGFALVEQPPTNAAPPAIISPIGEKQSSDKVHYANLAPAGHVETRRAARPIAHASGRIDTLAIFAEARARFNAEHTWSDLLSKAGATEMRAGYWACDCGVAHDHDIQIAVTSQDKIIGLSNRCGWVRNDKALDKFGFNCDRKYSGDYRAAAEAAARHYGLWVEPEQRQAAPPPAPVYRTHAQAAYNAQRRAQRRWAACAALEAWRAHLGTLDLPDSAHILGDYLHELSAGEHLQVHPTNAQIVAARGLSERTWQYAFRALEASGLGSRSGGRSWPDRQNECAVWTFNRAIHRVQGETPRAGAAGDVCTLMDHEHDLMPESVQDLVSPRGPAPTIANALADTPEAWQYAECDHSADELSALECTPENAAIDVRALLLRHGYTLNALPPMEILDRLRPAPYELLGLRVRGLDGKRSWDAPAHFTSSTFLAEWMVKWLPEWEGQRKGKRFRQAVKDIVAALAHADTPEPESAPAFDDSDQPERATFTPVELPSHMPYSGTTSRAHLSYELRAQLALETMRRRPEADESDQPEQQLLDPPRASKPRPNRNRPNAIDRYLRDLARMSDAELAGELKKHHATLKKHRGAQWLSDIRDRLGLVENEMDARDRYDQVRRRRSAITAPAAAGQLQLELVNCGNSATGFALSSVEGSPPLTSSLGP